MAKTTTTIRLKLFFLKFKSRTKFVRRFGVTLMHHVSEGPHKCTTIMRTSMHIFLSQSYICIHVPVTHASQCLSEPREGSMCVTVYVLMSHPACFVVPRRAVPTDSASWLPLWQTESHYIERSTARTLE